MVSSMSKTESSHLKAIKRDKSPSTCKEGWSEGRRQITKGRYKDQLLKAKGGRGTKEKTVRDKYRQDTTNKGERERQDKTITKEGEIEREGKRERQRDSGAPHLPVSMGSKAVGRQTCRRHAASYRKQNKKLDEHTSCEQRNT